MCLVPDNIQNLCEEIKSKENSVSVHIRRGDFVSNPTAAAFNAQLGFPYYSEAMNILEKNNKSIHYYIFSFVFTGNTPDQLIIIH